MDFSAVRNNPAEWGRVVESAVGAYLANEAMKGAFTLYYWRDRNDEVDFVIERNEKLIAIEVKSTFPGNKRGMMAFQKKYNPVKTISVDNRILPWQEFIRINPSDLF